MQTQTKILFVEGKTSCTQLTRIISIRVMNTPSLACLPWKETCHDAKYILIFDQQNTFIHRQKYMNNIDIAEVQFTQLPSFACPPCHSILSDESKEGCISKTHTFQVSQSHVRHSRGAVLSRVSHFRGLWTLLKLRATHLKGVPHLTVSHFHRLFTHLKLRGTHLTVTHFWKTVVDLS